MDEREKLKQELKKAKALADKHEQSRLGYKIGELNKELRALSEQEAVLKFESPTLKRYARMLNSIMARAKKKEQAVDELVFKADKSFLDGIAGWISKDCTKDKIEYFIDYFSSNKAHNIKIFRRSSLGDERWIGNIYLLQPEKNVFVLDAFQLATPTKYDMKQLWQEVIAKLKEALKGKKLYVSEFLSNYEQVRQGFAAAFPERKETAYRLDGFLPFESSKGGFWEV